MDPGRIRSQQSGSDVDRSVNNLAFADRDPERFVRTSQPLGRAFAVSGLGEIIEIVWATAADQSIAARDRGELLACELRQPVGFDGAGKFSSAATVVDQKQS